jgi:hypothetical protein
VEISDLKDERPPRPVDQPPKGAGDKMKRITTLTTTLVAALAMSTAAAATAAASTPEFKAEGGGSAVGTTFTSIAGAGELDAVETVKCAGGSSSGEITGASEVGKVVAIFTGCENKGKKCKSSGAAAGEIRTASLKGRLGEIEGGSGVGLLLEPASGTEYTKIEGCTLISLKITGKLIGELTPVGLLSTTEDLIYEHSGTKQAIETFKGAGEKDHLNGGLGVTYGITYDKAIEIV